MLSVRQARQPLTEKQSSPTQTINLGDLDVREEHKDKKLDAVDHTKTLQLFWDNKEKTIKISSALNKKEKIILVKCLMGNLNIFAWFAMDMPRVDPRVIVHRLNVLLETKPVK